MLPRSEYPRPQFQRNHFTCLNGDWDFKFDDNNMGLKEKWYLDTEYDMNIVVPFAYQSKLSGIHDTSVHDVVWYKRSFKLKDLKRTILHFGAVDYRADVWINGQHVCMHEGGHIGFEVDITDYIKEENILVVRAGDDARALDLPRGKQYWKDQSESIFYTRTTGIWQPVWLEQVPDTYLKSVYMTPDLDNKSIEVEFLTNGDMDIEVEISFEGTVYVKDRVSVHNKSKRTFHLSDTKLAEWRQPIFLEWTPENPKLIDITFSYKDDYIKSYFALRKVSAENGKVLLNNLDYYQKLLLDQGYWPDGILTAPTDEDFIKDIMLCKEMGFNGVRKHQKVEDPRFLYHADRLGFLVWSEAANAMTFTRDGAEKFTKEWMEIIKRDYNHPCIISWVPFNESWGVDFIKTNKDQQAFATSLYYLTKTFDQTRFVISNDGWDHTISDLFTIHDYQGNKDILKKSYDNIDDVLNFKPAKRSLYAPSWSYNGQPMIISEFGGIAYQKDDTEGWGYTNAVDDDDFIKRVEAVITGLQEANHVNGYCYTQITDVEQEINGLLTYDRKPKVALNLIKAINDRKK
ncbi:glycoside hydrolase family 2 [Acidaminobacter sp. JC074]|uniref:glycoside hydrolase family 2 protein n=1 Tax=Acidaminobacter sp. JC074 TaxID=2530199 RepID=UPI001F0EAE3C|nr:sugar-binding domain-containing protein [Acidaminobacter sp. JC074]MCH4887028.1 glycoside hydrolase family 2 [Acidaminobacter sp. JC074]